MHEQGYSPWRKSSRSGSGGSGSCVEIRRGHETFQIRDSKLGDQSPIFTLSESLCTALIEAVKEDSLEQSN